MPDAKADGVFRMEWVKKVPVVYRRHAKLGEVGKKNAHFFHLGRGKIGGRAGLKPGTENEQKSNDKQFFHEDVSSLWVKSVCGSSVLCPEGRWVCMVRCVLIFEVRIRKRVCSW